MRNINHNLQIYMYMYVLYIDMQYVPFNTKETLAPQFLAIQPVRI